MKVAATPALATDVNGFFYYGRGCNTTDKSWKAKLPKNPTNMCTCTQTAFAHWQLASWQHSTIKTVNKGESNQSRPLPSLPVFYCPDGAHAASLSPTHHHFISLTAGMPQRPESQVSERGNVIKCFLFSISLSGKKIYLSIRSILPWGILIFEYIHLWSPYHLVHIFASQCNQRYKDDWSRENNHSNFKNQVKYKHPLYL